MTDEYPTHKETQETMMVVITAHLVVKGSEVSLVQVGDLLTQRIVFNKPQHEWAGALSLATDIFAVIAERIDSLADEIEDGAEPLVILGQGDYTTTIQAPPPIAAKVAEVDSETLGYMRRYRKGGAK